MIYEGSLMIKIYQNKKAQLFERTLSTKHLIKN